MTITQVVETAASEVRGFSEGVSKFDALVAIQDEALRLIRLERSVEEEQVKSDLAALKKSVADKQARLDRLATLAPVRAPRSDKGTTRKKDTPISEPAITEPDGLLTPYIKRVGLIAFNRILGQERPGNVEGYQRAVDVKPEHVKLVMQDLEDEIRYQREHEAPKAAASGEKVA